MKQSLAFISALFLVAGPLLANLPALKVSDNHHFLVTEDGKPFFWLGDTAWELFHRLNREEADRYLEDRAAKGFTVVQAVAIAELDGHTDPNAYDLCAGRPGLFRANGENQRAEGQGVVVQSAQRLSHVHRPIR